MNIFPNNLFSVIEHLIEKGYYFNTVYDVGANKGLWTKKMLGILPSANFVLFEANNIHKKPKELDSRHNWFNVVLSSPAKSIVMFYNIQGTGDSYFKENTTHYKNITPVEMKTETLDNIIENHNLLIPNLIKLDTQGAELDILEGAKKILQDTDIITLEAPIMSYNQGAPCLDEYLSFLLDYNFYPIGLEGIQFSNGFLVQLDLVFVKKNIKDRYWGNNGKGFGA